MRVVWVATVRLDSPLQPLPSRSRAKRARSADSTCLRYSPLTPSATARCRSARLEHRWSGSDRQRPRHGRIPDHDGEDIERGAGHVAREPREPARQETS